MSLRTAGSRWLLGLLILATGTTASSLAAIIVGTNPSILPAIPDPILPRLPYVDTGPGGEVVFSALVVLLILTLWFRSRERLPYALMLIGLFYFVRAAFQLLLPLGHPLDAPAFDDRFHLYPFPYAYFPSGHVGLLTVLALCVPRGRIRIVAWIGVALIAFGTFVARTHYVADALGSVVIAYAVFAFGERSLRQRWFRTGTQEPVRPAEALRR